MIQLMKFMFSLQDSSSRGSNSMLKIIVTLHHLSTSIITYRYHRLFTIIINLKEYGIKRNKFVLALFLFISVLSCMKNKSTSNEINTTNWKLVRENNFEGNTLILRIRIDRLLKPGDLMRSGNDIQLVKKIPI